MCGVDQDRSKVVVYGAGGHAKTVLATIVAQAKYAIVGLLDDSPSTHGAVIGRYQVLGGRPQLAMLRNQGVLKAVVAIGDNLRRIQIAHVLQENGFELAWTVHPTTVQLPGSCIGDGTVVLAHAFVGADAVVGDNVIVSVGAVVGHDCQVGSGAQIGPRAGLGGHAQVGNASFIGMGASVLPGVEIGHHVIVGANAVVRKDLPDNVTAVGVPARIIKRRTPSA
jgi:UDP-perosamine 4-acetyltransferase